MAKRARATDSAAIEWRSAIHRLLLQQKRSSGGGWKPLALNVPTLFTTLYMVPDFPIQVAMQGKGGGHKGASIGVAIDPPCSRETFRHHGSPFPFWFINWMQLWIVARYFPPPGPIRPPSRSSQPLLLQRSCHWLYNLSKGNRISFNTSCALDGEGEEVGG